MKIMKTNFFKKNRFLVLIAIFLCLPATVCSYVIYTNPPNAVGHFPLQRKWSYQAEEFIRAIGSSENGITVLRTANYLIGLDNSSGKELWTNQFKSLNTFAPEFYEGMVFVTNKEGVWAFDVNSGELLWKVQAEPNYGQNKVAEISNCCVFISNVSQNVVVYDRLSGVQKWSVLSGRGFSDVFVENQVVYIVNPGIRALDEATGNILWEEGNSLLAQSAYQHGVIYEVDSAGYEYFTVNAFDVQSREFLWQAKLPSDGPPEIALLGDLVVAYSNSFLFGLELSTGKTLWQMEIDTAQTPVLLENVVYTRSLFGKNVQGIDAVTGDPMGSLSLGFPNLLPAVEYETVAATQDLLIVAEKNKVYGYGRK